MTTTIEDARKTAEDYVAENRRGAHVEAILEDEQDYFAQLALDDGTDNWPTGWAFIFVSKSTGKLWQGAPGEVMDKLANLL